MDRAATLSTAVLLVSLLATGCVFARRHYAYHRVADDPAGVGALPERCPPARSETETEGPREIPSSPLDLETAVDLALANNPRIGAAVARVRQAEAMLDRTRAVFLPRIGVDLSYLRADAPSSYLFKRIDQREFAQDTNFNDPGVIDNLEAGATARLNLFNGGRDVLRVWQAETGKRLRELDRRTARNAVIAATINAWYDLRAAAELVATAEASVETVRAQLAETERVFDEGGNALKSDVLALRVRLAETRERLIGARNHRELATAALANLLGGDADTAVAVDTEADCDCEVPPDYDAALLSAMLHRPELLGVRARVEQAALGIGQAEAAFHPSLDAFTRFYWDDPEMRYNAHETNWNLGLQLTWILGDGGARRAEVIRARAALREALAADRSQTLRVQLDVKRAYLDIASAEAREEVAGASLAAATEALDLVRQQFQAGTATITRYLEAELMLTRARMRRTHATYDLKKAKAAASRAIGRFTALAGVPEAEEEER